VAWASASGIVSGYGNGVFGTNDPVTHEQIVTILWRYDGSKTAEGELAFTDAGAIHDYALPAVRWAVENGIVADWAGDSFSPDAESTRAEVAAMFYRYRRSRYSGCRWLYQLASHRRHTVDRKLCRFTF